MRKICIKVELLAVFGSFISSLHVSPSGLHPESTEVLGALPTPQAEYSVYKGLWPLFGSL